MLWRSSWTKLCIKKIAGLIMIFPPLRSQQSSITRPWSLRDRAAFDSFWKGFSSDDYVKGLRLLPGYLFTKLDLTSTDPDFGRIVSTHTKKIENGMTELLFLRPLNSLAHWRYRDLSPLKKSATDGPLPSLPTSLLPAIKRTPLCSFRLPAIPRSPAFASVSLIGRLSNHANQ